MLGVRVRRRPLVRRPVTYATHDSLPPGGA